MHAGDLGIIAPMTITTSHLQYMVLSTNIILVQMVIFMILMYHVLSVILQPELHQSWFLLRQYVHLPGLGITMAT